MDCKEKIEECESILKQIIRFEPDPYYVKYFFNSYLYSVNNVYAGIFEEANRDFGLFISGKYTRDAFLEKAKIKDDQKAMDFLLWFDKKYEEEHQNPYPNFIKKSCKLQNEQKKLPKIKIMIRAKERYAEDPNQEILVNLKNDKLRSVEELQIEIKRQTPIFLDIINYKRNNNNEPRINEKQITVSTFLDIEDEGEIEIVYASKIYISVMKRLSMDVRKKIKELTIWT
ncbi:MAG TPA: hypothetical protein VLD64_01490 [Nitrosarchaeum sp.]|nr:hypothetical protein [Nitrosarchaeum sp.]